MKLITIHSELFWDTFEGNIVMCARLSWASQRRKKQHIPLISLQGVKYYRTKSAEVWGCLIPESLSADHRTALPFARVLFKWALAQRTCWIMFRQLLCSYWAVTCTCGQEVELCSQTAIFGSVPETLQGLSWQKNITPKRAWRLQSSSTELHTVTILRLWPSVFSLSS